MNRTIAVGVGGAGGWSALSWATEEAAGTRSRLVIHHVCEPDSLLARSTGNLSAARLELADPALARAVAAVRTQLGGDRVTLRVHTGAPGPALVDAAQLADLLVIGSGSHGGTVRQVVRRACGPVVVVRPSGRGPGDLFAGHVVVGVDDSAAGRAALEFGFGFADEHRLPVAAVSVSTGVRGDRLGPDGGWSTDATVDPELHLLTHEVEPWCHKYPQTPVRTAVLAGSVVDGLVRASAGALLLVVGDKHRGVISRVVTGDVPPSVTDRARCTVAVVSEGDRR